MNNTNCENNNNNNFDNNNVIIEDTVGILNIAKFILNKIKIILILFQLQ